MKIHKYRSLIQPDDRLFTKLKRIIRDRALWAAKPDSLNDQTEFTWTCDFTPSPHTVDLLADLLVLEKGRPREIARQFALYAVNGGGLESIAEEVIAEMIIAKSRDGVGVISFGTSADNDTLWKEYGGNGAGVCIELDVPDSLLGERLHRVTYSDDRRIHIDDVLKSRFDPSHAHRLYADSLLTKTTKWLPEDEVRFLSKRPAVEVVFETSTVTRVIVGDLLDAVVLGRVQEIAGSIPVVPRAQR